MGNQPVGLSDGVIIERRDRAPLFPELLGALSLPAPVRVPDLEVELLYDFLPPLPECIVGAVQYTAASIRAWMFFLHHSTPKTRTEVIPFCREHPGSPTLILHPIRQIPFAG